MTDTDDVICEHTFFFACVTVYVHSYFSSYKPVHVSFFGNTHHIVAKATYGELFFFHNMKSKLFLSSLKASTRIAPLDLQIICSSVDI